MLESFCKSFLTNSHRYHHVINIKNKFTFRLILILMVFNLLISLAILRQQTKLTVFFYYDTGVSNQAGLYEPELLTTLNAYRGIYIRGKFQVNQSLRSKLLITSPSFTQTNISNTTEIIRPDDYLLNRNQIISDLILSEESIKTKTVKAYFQPSILINNENICEQIDQDKIVIAILIHSHRNNFMRRKTMRDTWLSVDKFGIHDLLSDSMDESDLLKISMLNKKKIQIVHFFVLGTSSKHSNDYQASLDVIKQEADRYNDIIMIDVVDSYQNLLYKHLTVIDWVVKHCPRANFVMKLDDDVFVNIKALNKHLLVHLGLNYSNSFKFMYCSFVDKGVPARVKDSKWYVNNDEYPFDLYPRYCEGYSYITNVATLKLIHQQSRIIPRFWIDDVYFTGILLYGFQRIEWFDYKSLLPVSYYTFWEFSSYSNRLFASLLAMLNFNTVDFYRKDFFVILHIQETNKEVNYDISYEERLNSNKTAVDCYGKCEDDSKFHKFCVQLFLKQASFA